MFDHVALHNADFAAASAFYRTVLATLEVDPPAADEEDLLEWADFDIGPVDDGHLATTGLHVAFAAPSRAHVDAFHAAGLAHGAPDDGAPGERPEYSPDYYGAFLRDPDGNSVEAVHAGDGNATGIVDHLWIRVADHGASVAFYTLMGRFAGFEPEPVVPGERTVFHGGPGRGSFSIVADGGARTAHLHLAFPAPEPAVRDWHATATRAGHPDNGAPGHRAQYSPGYFGAFVLDPDGNNLELVDHQDD